MGAADQDEPAGPDAGTLFDDPPDYYPATPPPTAQTYELATGETLTLHLVGHSPLEAHRLWNGARAVADHFEAAGPAATVAGRAVLELGAGAGLPGLVAGARGARRVVITDFPDPDLLANMQRNIDACAAAGLLPPPRGGGGEGGRPEPVIVQAGYVWGADPEPLLALLPPDDDDDAVAVAAEGTSSTGQEPAAQSKKGFDVLVLADLLFRHSEHGRLVSSVVALLRRRVGSRAYVFFTSYRPWLRDKDLAFFDVARERGLVVEKVLERMNERPLFEDDPGDEEVRRTVSGYVLRWPEEVCKG